MGATFFALWMMGFLFCGLCALGAGLLALFFRRRRKAQGRSYTLSTVAAVVYLALAGLLLLPSVGFFGFIRVSNLAHSITDGFVDTGVYVEGGFQGTEFTVDGVTYRRLEGLSFHRVEGTDYPALYSWDNVGDTWNPLFLLFGPYHDRGNYYAVPNGPGFDLICDGSWRLFCPEEQTAAVTDWYGDMSHFDWSLSPHPEEDFIPWAPQPDAEAITALIALNEQAKEEGHVLWEADALDSCPAGPLEGSLLNAAMVILTGENRHLDDTLTLRPVSRDGAVRRESLSLCRYKGQFWLSPTASFQEDTAYYYMVPLPEDWNTLLAPLY